MLSFLEKSSYIWGLWDDNKKRREKCLQKKTMAKTSVLLEETRVFEPPKELAENSNAVK
jgi:hypothetical protein